MSCGLTPLQLLLLRFVHGYILANDGVSPTLRECADASGPRGRSTMHRSLVELERRGAIRRLPHKARAIEILTPVAVPMIGDQPLYAVPGPWDRREHADG